jgi:serralysin
VAKPVYTINQIKDQLSGTQWSGATVTFSIPDSAPDAGTESAGYQPMSVAMQARAADAFGLWDDVIGLTLAPTEAGGKISFAYSSSTGDGTYTATESYAPSGGAFKLTAAHVWMATTWESHSTDVSVQPGKYGFATYLHEIGHALGLDHPGPYDGSGEYAADALYAQDTERYSIMSYFKGNDDGSATNWTGKDGFWHSPSTPMLHDIAAAQAMYGADVTTRAGNTVYGFHATAGRDVYDFSKNLGPVLTIWDGGGTDTIDLSGYSDAARLDLGQGRYSNAGGMVNNLAIAYGAVIERGIGGSGGDTLIGNGAANRLSGGGGADKLLGASGADVLTGGAGNDSLTGGAGKDLLTGGAGTDTANYAGVEANYKVVYSGTQVLVTALTGNESTDTLSGIEKLHFVDHTILL